VVFHRPAGEKHFQQLFIHADEILADDLQRRLVVFRDTAMFHQLRESPSARASAVAGNRWIAFGVRVLLLQGVKRGANIVPVIFERQAHGLIVAGFSGLARLFQLCVPSFSINLALCTPFVSRSKRV